MGLATRLLRRGQRHRHLHRDDQRRGPDSGHAEANREDRLWPTPTGSLPTRRGPGRSVGGRVAERSRMRHAGPVRMPRRPRRRAGGSGGPGGPVGRGPGIGLGLSPTSPAGTDEQEDPSGVRRGARSPTPPALFGYSRPAIPRTTTSRRMTSSTAVSIGPSTRPTASGRAWRTTTTSSIGDSVASDAAWGYLTPNRAFASDRRLRGLLSPSHGQVPRR